jgi:hypothetical protein
MSCNNSTYHIAVDLDSPKLELGDCATARKTDLERHTTDRFRSKGHRQEVQSRIIPDSVQTDPEYVWGDEGPIND